MELRITVDIFSGRENPVVELSGREADEVLERLAPVRKLETEERRLPPASTLGYRGLIVEQLGERAAGLPKTVRYVHGDLFGYRLAHKARDEGFEDFFCGSTGPLRRLELGADFPKVLKAEVDKFKVVKANWPIVIGPFPIKLIVCPCAPIYEPKWWNVPSIQPYNNCYNYACNCRTDTFYQIPGGSQPGAASGAKVTSMDCNSVKTATIKDGLIDSPTADNKCPDQGHLVALVIWPGWDYHWYRKGPNGKWSHKPGGTPVTNLDNSGNYIDDPRTANRGGYTVFCTFMAVMHGHIKIK